MKRFSRKLFRLLGAALLFGCGPLEEESWVRGTLLPLSVPMRYEPCELLALSDRVLPKPQCREMDAETLFDFRRRTVDQGLDHHHRLALLEILSRGTASEKTIEVLRQAAEAAPKDGRLAADLGTALALTALERDQPEGLVRALDWLERAADSPEQTSTAFGRAWLLELLHLRAQALEAWNGYMQLDPASAWGDEARQRAEGLADDSSTDVSDPQSDRERALEESLPAWANAHMRADSTQAERMLNAAEELGITLAQTGKDTTVARSVAAIRHALENGQASLEDALAQAHLAFGEGTRRFRAFELADAARAFDETLKHLEESGDPQLPLRLWASVGEGGIALYRSEYSRAEDLFREALGAAAEQGLPALEGRALWGWGLSRFRQGRFAEALELYRRAADRFDAAGEVGNLGAVHVLIAESLRLLGRDRLAWRHRLLAGEALARNPSLQRRHNWLMEAAHAAHQGGMPRAALAIQNEGVRVATDLAQPVPLAEALLWHSKILLDLSRYQEAGADLHRARRQAAKVSDLETRKRLELDVLHATAELELRLEPQNSLAFLDDAVEGYGERRLSVDLAGALGGRARAHTTLGQLPEAEADLLRAIELFEEQRAALRKTTLLRSYAATAEDLFDQMIRLQVIRDEDRAAFDFAERARWLRAGIWGEARSPGETHVARSLNQFRASLRDLPPDVAWLSFAWLPDRLLVWSLFGGTFETIRHPIERQELEQMVASFVEGMRLHVAGSDEGLLLYHLLLPPMVRNLPHGVRLHIIPDKGLSAVPFAALRGPDGRFLIEQRAVAIFPSFLAQMRIQERERGRDRRPFAGATLVADPAFSTTAFPHLPRLPGAKAEVREAASLYGTPKILVGPQATRSQILNSLDQHPVFHFAGHSIDNSLDPARSHMVLAPGEDLGDDLLFAYDLHGLRFRHLRLVVLSSCNSLTTSDSRVAGLAGLARAFLDGGAAAVVASLWSVRDQATHRLLREFHRQLPKAPSAAEALRRAQLFVLRGGAEPSDWAVFQVVGDLELQ